MRILLVNTFYYPNMIGGTEHSVKLLAETLYSKGHEVAVFTIDSNTSLKETINNITIYRSGKSGFDYNARFFGKGSFLKKCKSRVVELYNMGLKKDWKWVLNDFCPEVVHTNNLYGLSPIVWKLAKENNIPVVHTLRDYFLLEPNSLADKTDWLSSFLKKIYKSYFRSYTKNVTAVTAPSRFVVEKYTKSDYFKSSIKKPIWNAVRINYEETEECINQKKDGDKTIFLFVGALLEIKGILLLLEAIERIESDYELRICGQGPLLEQVKEVEKRNSKVKYMGQLKAEAMAEQRRECHVAIVPSIWDEPFGRVVIEANAYGMPVIGSNRGGIKEILDFTETGITYQFDSSFELEKAIRYFMNKQNREKYIKNILPSLSHYDTDRQVVEFEQLYLDCISKEK